MQIKALLVCIAVAAALNAKLNAAEQPGVPQGWTASSSVGKQYEVGFDNAEGAMYMRANVDPGDVVGGLSQTLDTKPYLGRHLRLSAEIRNDSVSRAELFFRATGDRKAGGSFPRSFSVDTVSPQPGKWQSLNMVKIIPAPASSAPGAVADYAKLDYGFAMKGAGQIWVRNLKLEDVTDNPDIKREEVAREPISTAIPVGAPISKPSNLELRP